MLSSAIEMSFQLLLSARSSHLILGFLQSVACTVTFFSCAGSNPALKPTRILRWA